MRFLWTDIFKRGGYRAADSDARLLIEIRFSLARVLREKRHRCGVTQVQLATRLHSAPATISRIERASPRVAMEMFVRAMIELGADSSEIAAAFDAGNRTDVQKLRNRARRMASWKECWRRLSRKLSTNATKT